MASEVPTAGAQQDLPRRVAELERELADARDQQTAAAEILRLIQSSPHHVQPVFDTIVRSAVKLCGGLFSALYRFDGALIHQVAQHNRDLEAFEQVRGAYPRPPTRDRGSGRAILDRAVVHIPDVELDTEYDSIAPVIGWRSGLFVPMLRDGSPIGAIMVVRTERGPFSEHEIRLLKTFADQAVIAIENARLFADEQARTKELSEALDQQTATAEVLSVISSSHGGLDTVFKAMLANATKLCGASYGAIWLRAGDNGFRNAAFHGALPADFTEQWHSGRVFQPEPGVPLARVAQSLKPVHIADLRADQAYLGGYPLAVSSLETAGIRTLLLVPMLKHNELLGAIAIYRREMRPFTDTQIDLVNNFARQVVIAIENTRLFEEVQARTRELTESLHQQTATADVLKVISRSAFDLKAVLDTLVESAARLCAADMVAIIRAKEDNNYRHIVGYGFPAGFDEYMRTVPVRSGRGSLAGRVMQEGGPVQIADVLSDPDYEMSEVPKLGGFRTMLGVPLLRDGAPFGMFTLTRRTVQPFTPKQIELITTFADQTVIAIENARLFEEVQARTRELTASLEQQTATSEVLGVISSSPGELEPVFRVMLENAVRLCDASFGVLFRFTNDGVEAAALLGVPPEFAAFWQRGPQRPGPRTALGRVAETRRTVHIADVTREPAYVEGEPVFVAAVNLGRFRTILNVPMLKESELIGAFAVYRQEVRPFTEKQIELVETFADQAVIAIENARLFEEVQARTRELQQALDYQTATSDVLGVISRTPTNLQPVLAAICETTAKLCETKDVEIFIRDGDHLRLGWVEGPIGTEAESWPITHGLVMGRAVLNRELIQVRDLRAAREEYPEGYQSSLLVGHRTMIAVPLMRKGEAIGVLTLRRPEVKPFTDEQIALLRTFADQAVIAIENTRLFEEVQARTRELTEALEQQTATSEVLGVISRSKFDLQPVFDTMAESAVKLCQAERAFILRFDGTLLRAVAAYNVGPELRDFVDRHPIAPGRHSISARAALERRTVHVPDLQSDPEYAYVAQDADVIRTMLAVPLLRGSDLLGTITIYKLEAKPFTQRQIELVETFADQAVIAIENTRLFEEVQARNRDLTALGEVGRAVSSTLDLRVVLKAIVDRAVALSDTDAGSIYYYREDTGRFELGEAMGLDEDNIIRLRKLDIAAKDSGLGEAISSRKPLLIPDLTNRESNPLRAAAIAAGFRAALIVPLLGSEKPLGALVLQRRQPGEFPEPVVSLMQSFADQSAIALENARLFEELAQKGRELELASQHKSQFVANMSHELRTPLAAILGYAELMQEGFYEPLGQKSLDALTRIRSNGKHLLGLINTVLDIAKIESGQFTLNMAEYAIESVVETVRSATESLAQNKKLALKTEVAQSLPVGLGDEQRLTQVLLNLVGNAIKFTESGEVRIAGGAADGHFTVSVSDTGPGIPADECERIFEKFRQVDSSNTRAKGGTGLGLTIAKQIVEMHGGRIWVESALGKGSIFRMEFPMRAEFRKAAP
jgi:GAF domain-containing protein/anti-sigma regulatory factor (Ser/Thr protein kinase)